MKKQKYSLDFDKLIEYLKKGEEFIYSYTYESDTEPKGVFNTEVRAYVSMATNRVLLTRTLGYVEIESFELSSDQDLLDLKTRIEYELENHFDFNFNVENIIKGQRFEHTHEMEIING